MPDFAFLSGGRVFVKTEDSDAREIESPFAASIVQRAGSIARRNEWKTQGRGARFMMGMGGLPDELTESKFDAPPVRCTGLSRGRHPTEVIYALSTGPVSGLFGFSGGEEERILHGNEWHVAEPACEPAGARIACVVRGKRGQEHIALLTPGRGIEQITEGDVANSAPCWVAGENRILFESRAFGYDRNGRVVEYAPATIQQLDASAGLVSSLVEIDQVNCSSPRAGNDGSVYYLRRPRAQRRGVPLWSVVLDALLFPFRLLFALLQYLNMFSLTYSGKPLLSARNTRAKQADIRRAAQVGNLASAAADTREEEELKIPEDWTLVRRASDSKEHTLAKRVLCYDVYIDGSVLWSDGRRVMHQTASGPETCLGKFEDVGLLLALDIPR